MTPFPESLEGSAQGEGMEFLGKAALITGGGGGISGAIACELARGGADIVLNDIDENLALSVQQDVQALGRRAEVIVADVTRAQEVEALFKHVTDLFGRIDILVNSTGFSQIRMVEDIEETDWHRALDVNLTAVFLCCKAAIPIMKAQGRGKIVTMSTVSAHRASIFSGAHYVAAKTGLLGLTRELAYELAPFNIQVNAVCPGTTFTPQLAARVPQARRDLLLGMVPTGRFATPEDHAYAVAFLASEKANFITGISLDVDGGSLLSWMDYETFVAARGKSPGIGRQD